MAMDFLLSLTDNGACNEQDWWMHLTLALPFDHGRGEDWSDAHRPAAPVQHSEVATVQRAPPDLLAQGHAGVNL